MDKLDELVEKASNLEKQIKSAESPENEATVALAAAKRRNDPPSFERKMRFEAPDDNAKWPPVTWIKRGQEREYSLEELTLGRMLLDARGQVLPDALESRWQSLASRLRKYTMTTTGTGTGAELTDTILWNQLFEDIHAQTLVAGLFVPYLDMVSGKMELSEMGDATFYKPAGEGQAVTATDLVTAKRALTAYIVKAEVGVSDEEAEDAIINMIMGIRTTLVRNAAEVIDELILNGDASTGKQNINYYAATGGSDLSTSSRFLIGFDGLLHYCLNEVTGQKVDLGALGVDDFATLIGLAGKYADNSQRCAFILDRWANLKAIQLDDFRTVDKLGDRATLLRGQVGAIYNVPVIMSPQLAKSNATGQVDQTSGNNTKGRIALVNRDMWKLGFRRQVTVAAQRDESKGLTSIVCTMRMALQCFGDRSDAKYSHTALGFDVTV